VPGYRAVTTPIRRPRAASLSARLCACRAAPPSAAGVYWYVTIKTDGLGPLMDTMGWANARF